MDFEQASMDTNPEQPTVEVKKKENVFKRIFGFFKSHKKLSFAITALLLALVVCVIVLSCIHSARAKEIEQAQIGMCYRYDYSGVDSYYTEIWYFREDGYYSHLYMSFTDADRTRLDYFSGSLSEPYSEYSVEISLFGQASLDYTDIEVDDQLHITHYGTDRRTWTPISLEEAQAIEQRYAFFDKMNKIRDETCYSAVGVDGFLERLNESLKPSVKKPTIGTDKQYIDAAKSLLSEHLKNPSSAVYNSERVVEKDSYGRAIVALDVSAQNSFGGYVRSKHYICINSISSSSYTYNSYAYSVDDSSMLDYLKSANNWEEDPSIEYDLVSFQPGQPLQDGTVEVNGITLERYKITSPKATYIVYIEPTTQYVISAEIIIDKKTFSEEQPLKESRMTSAIDGAMKGPHNLLNTYYWKVIQMDDGIVSPTPYFRDSCGCMYHAVEKDGKYHISVTNILALGCDQTNYWSPLA